MAGDKSFTGMLDGMSEEGQEIFLDEMVRIKREEHVQYIHKLEEDHPLGSYSNHYLATNEELSLRDGNNIIYKDHLNWWTATSDEIDLREEREPPLLFATIPMGGEVTKIVNGENIDVLTKVQITFISGLGDVGINTNLEPTDKYQARVHYDTLSNYRSTVDVKFNP